MKIRISILSGVVFSIAAVMPIIMIFSVLLGIELLFRNMNIAVILLYFVTPMICAFISGSFIGAKICFDQAKLWGNLLASLIYSILVVVVSLILWTFPAYIILPDYEEARTFELALAAGTIFGFATYIPALVAGFLLWFLSKHNKKINKDTLLSGQNPPTG